MFLAQLYTIVRSRFIAPLLGYFVLGPSDMNVICFLVREIFKDLSLRLSAVTVRNQRLCVYAAIAIVVFVAD